MEKVSTLHHEIICGDCVVELKKIPDTSIDAVITDPPFNIGKKYRTYGDKLTHTSYLQWCKEWLTECIRVMKEGSALYLINYPENNAYIFPFLNERLTFRRWLVWHYHTNTGLSPYNYTRSHHSILFFTKGKQKPIFNKDDIAEPYQNPTDKRIQKLIEGGSKGRTPYDVFYFDIVKNVSKDKTDHPCQIPVPLLEIFIKASTNRGDTVLDPFGGSFSTAAACQNLSRKSISIEIDSAYCEIGKNRLAPKFAGGIDDDRKIVLLP